MNKYYVKVSIESNATKEYSIDSRRVIKDLLDELGYTNNPNYILSKKQNRQINIFKSFQEEQVYTGDILRVEMGENG